MKYLQTIFISIFDVGSPPNSIQHIYDQNIPTYLLQLKIYLQNKILKEMVGFIPVALLLVYPEAER